MTYVGVYIDDIAWRCYLGVLIIFRYTLLVRLVHYMFLYATYLCGYFIRNGHGLQYNMVREVLFNFKESKMFYLECA